MMKTKGSLMSERAFAKSSLVLLVLACATEDDSQAKAPNHLGEPARTPSGQLGQGEVLEADPIVPRPREGTGSSQSPTFSTTTTSDGKVTTTLGPMVATKSTRAIQYVFATPTEGAPGRIYLSHQVVDDAGNVVTFELEYASEKSPFDLVQRGYLTVAKIGDSTTEDIAVAGAVTVAEEPKGQLRISFSGLRMAHLEADGVTKTERGFLGDGVVVGAVERSRVVRTSNQERVDPTWSHEFCAPLAR